jgi:hypothetical protein
VKDRLPEAPGTPLRALIDKSCSYMRRRDDGTGWDGAGGLVREAFRLGRSAPSPEPESAGGALPFPDDAGPKCDACKGRGWIPGDCHPLEVCGTCNGTGYPKSWAAEEIARLDRALSEARGERDEWAAAAQEVVTLFDPAQPKASPALLVSVAHGAKRANREMREERQAREDALREAVARQTAAESALQRAREEARREGEAAITAIDVWARNLAKGVTCRYWEGGPEALKRLPPLDSLALVEERIAHLGRLQHLYCRDVGRLRNWFHRAMRLARALSVPHGADEAGGANTRADEAGKERSR